MSYKQAIGVMVTVLLLSWDIHEVEGQSSNADICRTRCEHQRRFFRQFISASALQLKFEVCTSRCPTVPPPVLVTTAITTENITQGTFSSTTSTTTSTTPTTSTTASTTTATSSTTKVPTSTLYTTLRSISTPTTIKTTSATTREPTSTLYTTLRSISTPTTIKTTSATTRVPTSTLYTTLRSISTPTTIKTTSATSTTILRTTLARSSPHTTATLASTSTADTTTTNNITTTTVPSFECGIQRPGLHSHRYRIVGGITADECEYPWVVHISVLENVCAGAILDKRHVLTAAHCVSRGLWSTPVNLNTVYVRVGSSAISKTKAYPIVNITVHPQYNSRTKINDAAILTLAGDLDFSECQRPICLPEAGSDPKHAEFCVVAGWGVTRYGSKHSMPNLLEVDLSIVDQTLCQRSYDEVRVNDRTVCAGDYYNGGIDACQGDSGAPLMCRVQGRYVAYGIVSNGYNCALRSYPGIYTKVSHEQMLQFISMTTGRS